MPATFYTWISSISFGLKDSTKQTLKQYIKKMKSGATKRQPEYVFQELSAGSVHNKGTVEAQSTAGGSLMADYTWRPGFLQHPHDSQYHLRHMTHQFFVGSPGTGAPIHW
jgi:hypothetical protein